MCACKYCIREERHTAKTEIARKLNISLGAAQSNVHVHLDYIRVCAQFALHTAHCAPKSFTDDVFDTLHRSQRAASAVYCYRGQTWVNHATPTHGVTSQEIQSNAISKQHHSDCLWDHKVCFFWISWTVAKLYNC